MPAEAQPAPPASARKAARRSVAASGADRPRRGLGHQVMCRRPAQDPGQQRGDLLGSGRPRPRRGWRPSARCPRFRPAAVPAPGRGRARQPEQGRSGSHSACQAPAARWCSCSRAATRVASSPGTCLVQPRMATTRPGCACSAWRTTRRGGGPRPAPQARSLVRWSLVTRPGALSRRPRDLAHLGLGQQRHVPGDLAERRRGRASAAPASVIRSRSVCHGTAAEPAGSVGEHRRDPGPRSPRARGARGAAELDREPAGRGSRPARRRSSRPVSQPAATAPKVTGTACCSRVRPIMGVARYSAASAAAAPPPRARSAGIRRGPGGPAASPRCRGCPGWSRPGAPPAAGPTRASGRASAGTGLPVSADCWPSSSRSKSSARAALVTASPAPGACQPGLLERPGPGAASVSSIACSQAWSETSTGHPAEDRVEEPMGSVHRLLLRESSASIGPLLPPAIHPSGRRRPRPGAAPAPACGVGRQALNLTGRESAADRAAFAGLSSVV